MDKLEFTNVLIDYLENDLKCDFQMESIKNTKDNGIVKNGIAFYKSDNQEQRMIFYIDDDFEDYISFKRSLSDIGKELLNIVNQIEEPTDMLDFWKDTIKDFEKSKEYLFIKLSTPEYADKLDVPYTNEGEFIATYYVGKFDSDMDSSIRINDSILKSWGKDINEIREAALKNNKDTYLLSMKNIIFGFDVDNLDNINLFNSNEAIEQKNSYVLSNKLNCFGASALLDVDTLEKVYNKTKSDFVIAPICKHEAIIIPTLFKNEKDFERIGKEVIENSVAPEEVLSDIIYRYDSLNKKIVTNNDYEKNYYDNLTNVLISICKDFDPYEFNDSFSEDSFEVIKNQLLNNETKTFIDTLNNISEDLKELTQEKINTLYGTDFDKKVDRVLNHLNTLQNGKELKNDKPKPIK